jgi:hypothetical protein
LSVSVTFSLIMPFEHEKSNAGTSVWTSTTRYFQPRQGPWQGVLPRH